MVLSKVSATQIFSFLARFYSKSFMLHIFDIFRVALHKVLGASGDEFLMD